MDNKNQNPETQTPERVNSPTLGTNQIQPDPLYRPPQPSAQAVPTAETSQPSPSSDQPGIPPPQASNVTSVYPEPAKGFVGGPIYTKNDFEKEEKKHKHLKGLIIGGCAIVILLVVGMLLATNYNLRATLFDQRLRQYTFINSTGDEYRILFYKGSTEQTLPDGTPSQLVLVSPPIGEGESQMFIALNGKDNDTNSQAQTDVEKNNNCTLSSTFSVKAFSLYIKSEKITANICTNAAKSSVNHVDYASLFGNNKSVFFEEIAPYTKNQVPNSSELKAFQSTNPNINDIKTILASFKYLG